MRLTQEMWHTLEQMEIMYVQKKQDVLDRIITEALNKVIREGILAENRKKKVLG